MTALEQLRLEQDRYDHLRFVAEIAKETGRVVVITEYGPLALRPEDAKAREAKGDFRVV